MGVINIVEHSVGVVKLKSLDSYPGAQCEVIAIESRPKGISIKKHQFRTGMNFQIAALGFFELNGRSYASVLRQGDIM